MFSNDRWKGGGPRPVRDAESDSITPAVVRTLFVRMHSVTIRFEFDDERIQIHYVASTNMQYVERWGERLIHPKYTQWIENLERDLKGELYRLRK